MTKPLTIKFKLIATAIIICLGLAIYSNSFHSEFQFDDKPFIVLNEHIKNLADIKGKWHFYKSRFVGLMSFALNYHFHKLNVFGYHITNTFIHIINALLLWWFVRLIFATQRIKKSYLNNPDRQKYLPLCIALLFLVHPLQTQAVTYICQRFASLATLFYLLSMCCYLKFRLLPENSHSKKHYIILMLISTLMAVFTKEIAFTLPFVIIFIECFLLKEKTNAPKKTKNYKTILLVSVLSFIVMIIPLLFSFNVTRIIFRQLVSGSHDGDIITSYTYLLTQFRVIVHYISLLLFPFGQTFDYDFPISHSFLEAPTLLSFVLLVMIIFISFKNYKKMPLLAVGAFWFFTTLLVESSIIPIPHVIFEHRMYLPSIGFCIAIFCIISHFIKNNRAFYISTITVLIAFSFLTYQRNYIYHDEVTFWIDNVSKSPNKTRPYNNLATALIERDQYHDAFVVLKRGKEIGAKGPQFNTNFGDVYFASQNFLAAKEHYEFALKADPTYVEALNGLGKTYMELNNLEKAEEILWKAMISKPTPHKVVVNYGRLQFRQGFIKEAIDLFEQIVQSGTPVESKVFLELGEWYLQTDQKQKALLIWKNGLKLYPNNQDIQANIQRYSTN